MIILSLVALGPVSLPVSVLRLVRAFRVIRLFGRMRELKKILSALSASIIPELNAFMIMFIVVSICAPPIPAHDPFFRHANLTCSKALAPLMLTLRIA